MRLGITDVIKSHPNLIHVAGHERSLQLIHADVLEVISGAASTKTPLKKVVKVYIQKANLVMQLLMCLLTQAIRISYFTLSGESIKQAFTYLKEHTEPARLAYNDSSKGLAGNSIKLKLGDKYNQVSGLHKSLLAKTIEKCGRQKQPFLF